LLAARFEGEGASSEALKVIYDYEANRDLLDADKQSLIDFGLNVAFEPSHITDDDVEELRSEFGLSDEALVELVSTALIASNLASVNQVFNLVEGADES
jgi:alkylhydroperoxidase family enzyme